jgi:hypothetical protein
MSDKAFMGFKYLVRNQESKDQILSPRLFFYNQQLTRIRIINERLVRDQEVDDQNQPEKLSTYIQLSNYLEFETKVATNRRLHQGRILYIYLLQLCPFRARPERTSFLCPNNWFEAHTPILFAEENSRPCTPLASAQREDASSNESSHPAYL